MSNQEFYNKIADISMKHFTNLPKTGKPKDTEWTILSCILKQDKSENLEVVALGTGSKCIGKSKMCPKGTIINDSHAEVICRRAFLRYLYDQIKISNSEDSIFIFKEHLNKFIIKPDVKFHFFTTHVPCGDAAIFAKQNSEDFGNVLNNSENFDKNKVNKNKIKDSKKDEIIDSEDKIFIDNECDNTVRENITSKPGETAKIHKATSSDDNRVNENKGDKNTNKFKDSRKETNSDLEEKPFIENLEHKTSKRDAAEKKISEVFQNCDGLKTCTHDNKTGIEEEVPTKKRKLEQDKTTENSLNYLSKNNVENSNQNGTKICIENDYEVLLRKGKLSDEAKDIFRTGAKCLQNDIKQDLKESGADYHVLGAVRTKPGRGDPTMSVSCSDKIAKWCHLGIQGALFSLLIDKPIYLSSFTIVGGTPFDVGALERALYGRLEEIHLKEPFQNVKILIGQVQRIFNFCKNNGKSPCVSSIAWVKTKNERPLEILVNGRKQGVTKKNLFKESAMLKICKLELFRNFCSVITQFQVKVSDENCDNLKYLEIKNLAKEYQQNWKVLKEKFGVWTVKDSKFLQFCCR